MNDVIIIGGGPAGLSAAIYSARGGMDTLVIEKIFTGGQMSTTDKIENYPGIETISGIELALVMEKQAKDFGAKIISDEVTGFELDSINKVIKTKSGTYMAKAVVLAMGASPKEIGVPGESKFRGAGVSYCATCDGAFFRNKTVAVIGGGNTAVEDAIYLTKLCSKVYLVHRRDTLRAEKILQEAAAAAGVEFIWNTTVEDILGGETVENILLKNIKTNQTTSLPIDGVFVAIGTGPNSGIVRGMIDMNDAGYIHADDGMQTNIFGVYAAGDIREKNVKQVISAASDGATAAQSAIHYIGSHQWAT